MKLLLLRFTAAVGLAGCLFGAAEVGVLGNYYARVEDRARAWCGARANCRSVERGGTLGAPLLFVTVKGAANPAGVESELRAASALKAPRQAADPKPRDIKVVIRSDDRVQGGKP